MLLDAMGIGSINIVDTVEAVTVVGAVVSPIMITDTGDVDTGTGEIVTKIVVIDVEKRMVVASTLSLALSDVLAEAVATLASTVVTSALSLAITIVLAEAAAELATTAVIVL